MATAKLTGNGQQKTFRELFCSPGLAAELHGQVTFLSVLNSLLSVTAFLGNSLILISSQGVFAPSAVQTLAS